MSCVEDGWRAVRSPGPIPVHDDRGDGLDRRSGWRRRPTLLAVSTTHTDYVLVKDLDAALAARRRTR